MCDRKCEVESFVRNVIENEIKLQEPAQKHV